MKKKTDFLNTLLAAVLGCGLLIAQLVRAFAPAVILPALNIPNMVLISLIALLLERHPIPGGKRNWICVAALGALTFGLLPFAACFVGGLEALKLGLAGGIVFTVTTWLFDSMRERISTGPAAKAAPVVSALGLYLAAQCFSGILL